jgi:putative ABC transport system permease protein
MIRRSSVRPTIVGLRPSTLVFLYGWRLSHHKIQELLAGLGIAIGVALFFGVLVASTSITSSVGQILHAVTGTARLQLIARSSDGFDEQTAKRVDQLPGVVVAAPILRESAAIVGPDGRESIQLVGVTATQIALKGAATRNLANGGLPILAGIGLSSGVAGRIGAQAGETATVLINGNAHSVPVRAVLGSQTVGPVANSPLAIAPLSIVQRLSNHPGGVTEVYVAPAQGESRQVEAELRRLAAGKLNVEPANHELTVLKATAAPANQSTTLFAAISAMIGFLLALNAMLLTVPERRRFAADLRTQGYTPRQIVLILGSQAMLLGTVASCVGVAMGDVLSHTLFHQVPSYLTLAFPIGTQPVIPVTIVIVAVGCGVLATLLASLPPILLDLRPGRPIDAVLHETGEAGQHVGRLAVLVSGVLGALLLIAVTALVLAFPSLTVIGGVVLAFTVICLIPLLFVTTVRVLSPASEGLRRSMLPLAVLELDATATRSIALTCVTALAIYGAVAIGGARGDLARGLDQATVEYLDTADIWVTTSDNFLTTESFTTNHSLSDVAHAPGVASVRIYRGSLLDVGSRRLWIRARPVGDRTLIQASQLLHGDLSRATSQIRNGGWAAISSSLAEERHLHIGDPFTLPTPSGAMPLRVAAITNNVGWPPGAITINANEYSRYWNTTNPTALEINLEPGVSPLVGKRSVEQALGHQPGLLVQTYDERKTRYQESARQGLESLGEISMLLVMAAILAIAFALSAIIWQRRAHLASLRAQGYDRKQLLRALLLEGTILLSIGCLAGAVLGVYGHILASRWLKSTTGFPTAFSLGGLHIVLTLAIVIGVALAVIALPGVAATRVPPYASFQE